MNKDKAGFSSQKKENNRARWVFPGTIVVSKSQVRHELEGNERKLFVKEKVVEKKEPKEEFRIQKRPLRFVLRKDEHRVNDIKKRREIVHEASIEEENDDSKASRVKPEAD